MVDVIDGGNAASTFEEDETGFVGTYSPASRQVSEVIKAVRRQFGDDAGVQIEDSDIIRWVNDAQDEIANRNKYLKATSTMSAIPGTRAYRWPTERILQVESVHYDGKRIRNVPFAAAEEFMDDNSTSTGTPRIWYEWAGKFVFHPAPDADKEVTLYLTLKPQLVTSSSDLLSVPDRYYSDVVRYVLAQAYEMDEDWEAVKAKQDQFDASVNDLAEEDRTAQNMTYETITLVDDWC